MQNTLINKNIEILFSSYEKQNKAIKQLEILLREYVKFDFNIVINHDGVLLLSSNHMGGMQIEKAIDIIKDNGLLKIEDCEKYGIF